MSEKLPANTFGFLNKPPAFSWQGVGSFPKGDLAFPQKPPAFGTSCFLNAEEARMVFDMERLALKASCIPERPAFAGASCLPPPKDVETPLVRFTTGSHSYGTATEDSDNDYMEVYVAPESCYLGVKEPPAGKQKLDGDEDTTRYELKHFVSLCMNANPNVLPVLWNRTGDYAHVEIKHPAFRILLGHREEFLSEKVYHAFCGFATSQEKRMLGETTGKMGDSRKEMVEKFGYDPKYAYHMVRSLRMCQEALREGRLFTFRTWDRGQLMEIRNGWMTLKDVLDLVAEERRKCDELVKNNLLPKTPSYHKIDALVNTILRECLFGK